MSTTGPDIEALLQELRATVAARRASGQYPDGLEDDLDAHFQRIIESRPGLPRLALFRRRVETARRASRFSAARISMASKVPGGQVLHRAMAKLFIRQAHGIFIQVQEFADRTLDVLDSAVGVLESPDTHRHSDVIEILDAHSEILAGRERAPSLPAERLADLLGRVESLDAAAEARRWRPWFSRAQFEAAFARGPRIRAEEMAAAALGERSPVVHLGAGANTLVERLTARGVDATASDAGDPVAALAGWGPAGLAGIVLLEADAHLTAAALVDLIGLARDRLASDGRLILSQGPGPAANEAEEAAPPPFDPTLGPPLGAEYAAFVCRAAGFESVEVQTWPPSGYLIVATR